MLARILLSMALIGGFALPVSAQHIPEQLHATHVIIPQSRPFNMSRHAPTVAIDLVQARIAINDQAAATTLDIALSNPSRSAAEAVLLLPVPDGAVVSAFAFEGNASEATAQVLAKEEARRVYDEIVRTLRDPALLEFAGYSLIRSSVFPVPAGGMQRVRLTYEHLLSAEGNRVDYALPRTESLDRRSPWKIEVDVRSREPISTLYSPSHELTTSRRGANRVTARLAEHASLTPGPFLLSYLREREDVSASFFAYPDPKVGGGYFLMMAGLPAAIDEAEALIRREVTIVLDRSGSMAGPKMDQAKAAALQVIEALADGEAFNIIDYATDVAMFAAKPVAKDEASTREARRYLAALRPIGGTNIHDALLEALRQAPTNGTLPIVLFLTDGLPTIGRTSETAIGELIETGNPHQRRVFTFGVGHDVNAPLLDRLADQTRATSTYVLPEEDVEVKVAGVFRKLYGPVFASGRLRTLADDEVSTRLVRELIPDQPPDLFEGDQLIVLGQYRSEEKIAFELDGKFLGRARAFRFTFDPSEATTRHAFVPRLWASRRIAILVDEIRQAGAAFAGGAPVAGASIFNDPRYKELADEILRLSTEFGILTEYTSFLATEGTDLSDWDRLQVACNLELEEQAVRTRSGAGAVSQAQNSNFRKSQTWLNSDNRFLDDELNTVQTTAVQQVSDRAFFRRGDRWIDSRIVSAESSAQPEAVIDFGSPEHATMVEALVREGRQAVLSLPGDIVIEYSGRVVLVNNSGAASN